MSHSRPEYGNWFWRNRGRLHDRERWTAEILWRHFHPASVYDAGCGAGSFLSRFQEHGCLIGGSDANIENGRAYAVASVERWIECRDLSIVQEWPRRHDLVLCVEVGEHLPEGTHSALFTNLRRLLAAEGHIFFTGAQPKQFGYGHISPRRISEWIAEAAKERLRFDIDTTYEVLERFRKKGDPLKLGKNAMVFVHDSHH